MSRQRKKRAIRASGAGNRVRLAIVLMAVKNFVGRGKPNMLRYFKGHLLQGLLVVILIICAAGCNKDSKELSFKFTFEQDAEGWQGGFADLPVDYEPDLYELEFARRDLPVGLNGEGKSLMLSGHNRSDDLFMYLKKELKGSRRWNIPGPYSGEICHQRPGGCGWDRRIPGESVWMKIGAAARPVPVAGSTGNDHYRLNVDKGNQNNDGTNAVRIGNVAKEGGDDENYALKILDNINQPLQAAADNQGNLWVFVGTDSGFEGKTTLFYSGIDVFLEKVK